MINANVALPLVTVSKEDVCQPPETNTTKTCNREKRDFLHQPIISRSQRTVEIQERATDETRDWNKYNWTKWQIEMTENPQNPQTSQRVWQPCFLKKKKKNLQNYHVHIARNCEKQKSLLNFKISNSLNEPCSMNASGEVTKNLSSKCIWYVTFHQNHFILQV